MNSPANNHTLGIRGRLLIGFTLISLILIVMVTVTLIIISSTKNELRRLLDVDLPTYENIVFLSVKVHQSESVAHRWLTTQNQIYKQESDEIWNSTIIPAINKLDNLSHDWRDKKLLSSWNTLKPLMMDLKSANDKLFNMPANTTSELTNLEAKAITDTTEKIENILEGSISETGHLTGGLYDHQMNKVEAASAKIISDMSFVQTSEYVLSILGIIIAIGVALLTARGILRHISSFREQSSRIASGDLRERISLLSNDEIGQLGQDLNIMTDSLANVTKQITQACHNMVAMLEEVKHSVDVQSSGATEQASSINQITASLEEIEKSSNQTMEKAMALGEAAEKTQEKGEQGLEAVEQSVLGMKSVRDKVQMIAQTILELSKQTQQVGDITAVVNRLAQQSKMLALNASIEAAKAGEAGKGFAVVASEVKNLAEQSEQSTSQVQKILENIRQAAEKAVMVTEEGTKGVDHGTLLVEETGNIVRSLSDVIHETTIASQQIEAAVRQEGVGIEQITAGMNEINQVTSTFVESVKQTTEAISNLSVIAKNLKEHIDTYKI